jgi:hypothetical protein
VAGVAVRFALGFKNLVGELSAGFEGEGF